MSENEQGLGAIFLEALFKKYETLSESFKTELVPKLKQTVKIILFFCISLFFLSFLFMALGLNKESNEFIVIGRIGIILSTFMFLVLATPIGFVFAGKKYIVFVRSFALYQLFSTLVIWLSPIPATLSILFGISLAGFVLAAINALGSDLFFLRLATTIVFCASLINLYFPYYHSKFNFSILTMNEPALLKLNKGDVSGGKVRFFLKGNSVVWYALDSKGRYELFDRAGYPDTSGEKLKPITEEIGKKLKENEKLISPRNFVLTTPSSSPVGPKNKPLSGNWEMSIEENPNSQEQSSFNVFVTQTEERVSFAVDNKVICTAAINNNNIKGICGEEGFHFSLDKVSTDFYKGNIEGKYFQLKKIAN